MRRRPHVVVATAVSKGEVADTALPQRSSIHDEAWIVVGPRRLGEATGGTRPPGLQQRLDRPVVLAQVQLVSDLKWAQARDHRVVLRAGRERDAVLIDGRVGEELTSERVGEQRKGTWRREQTLSELFWRVDGVVRSVQREPAPAGFDPGS